MGHSLQSTFYNNPYIIFLPFYYNPFIIAFYYSIIILLLFYKNLVRPYPLGAGGVFFFYLGSL
jgi:hypothetical protein